jgi:serine/threonine protein kinase
VKSISLSESVNNREIKKEIEKAVNVLHPCIAPPRGFVFRGEPSELRELKIVRLFVEGCSLTEVLLTNPVWWTPTMKAKVVAGIALALRFAHSFGLIHRNLNSSNILFDESHRIQIISFGHMDLEVDDGERWTAQVDLRAFESLLLEITVGQTSSLPGDADSEGTVNLEVPKLVSTIIKRIQSEDDDGIQAFDPIIDILKRNKFQIEAGIDSKKNGVSIQITC